MLSNHFIYHMTHASFLPMSDDEFPDTDTDLGPSRSQLKRDAEAMTKLGAQLVSLDEKVLRQFPLPENILDAVIAARKIRQRGAHKRQLHFIGKLLRLIDTDAITSQLASLHTQSRQEAMAFQRLEQWRDKLLADDQAVTTLLNEYPAMDSQHLRQLIRSARKEQQLNKPPAAARSLFRYLRSIILDA